MNKQIIIGFTGRIASGKDESADYLLKKYNGKLFTFSSSLRQTLAIFHLPTDRQNMQNISTILRQTFGENILAKVVAEDIKKCSEQFIVISGIRRLADIEYLRALSNFHLVSVESEQKTRYERVIKRGQNNGDSQKTWEEFLSEEQAETETTLDKVMAMADSKINNNGSFEDLYKALDDLTIKICQQENS